MKQQGTDTLRECIMVLSRKEASEHLRTIIFLVFSVLRPNRTVTLAFLSYVQLLTELKARNVIVVAMSTHMTNIWSLIMDGCL